MSRAFTLLELMVVVIILGILATLGFIQYTKTVEKGRTSEAKAILGQIRSAEESYYVGNDAYVDGVANLQVSAPTSCATTHYFYYTASTTAATAIRCTSGGKTPDAQAAYSITVSYAAGTWGGSAGYY